MLSDILRDPAGLLLLAIVVTAISGVPGLVFKTGWAGQRLATLGAILAALLALPSAITLLLTQRTSTFSIAWNLPFDTCEVALDPLTTFFLIPVFLVFLCGSVYANGYWPGSSHRSTEPSITFFYGMLAASMALVVVARNGVLFLIAWEIMALSAYFLMVAEHDEPEVRAAGYVYLIATHIGTAALIVAFSLMRFHTSSFLFPSHAGLQITTSGASMLFIAALIGFGSKAGLMPLHIWLPAAHANSPSHVSAILSGVMLKMGIYGILRFLSFMPAWPLWWGALLAVGGLVSALLGICLAVSQKDIKRLLAYSSIENIGIITAGIGIAVIGQSTGNPRLAWLGFAGALLHILNHGFFKPLLFMCAGSVIHATGTRELDRMGGLSRRMRWTSFLSLCGVIAISGLPPFNGFASEFLLYLGFFGEATAAVPYVALGAPILALVGGVAVICFVKMHGITFLGNPRSDGAARCHEAPVSMIAPMSLLAILCLLAGMAPQAFIALVSAVLTVLIPGQASPVSIPPQSVWFTAAGTCLLGTAGIIALVFKRQYTSQPSGASSTWGCGYLRPTGRMQYSGTSFGEMLTSLMKGIVRTRIKMDPIIGFTPRPAAVGYAPEETILERLIMPAFHVTGICFSFLRRLQHGQSHIYMLYIFVTLVLLMLWVH